MVKREQEQYIVSVKINLVEKYLCLVKLFSSDPKLREDHAILYEKFYKNRSLIYGGKIQEFEGQRICEEVCHYL